MIWCRGLLLFLLSVKIAFGLNCGEGYLHVFPQLRRKIVAAYNAPAKEKAFEKNYPNIPLVHTRHNAKIVLADWMSNLAGVRAKPSAEIQDMRDLISHVEVRMAALSSEKQSQLQQFKKNMEELKWACDRGLVRGFTLGLFNPDGMRLEPRIERFGSTPSSAVPVVNSKEQFIALYLNPELPLDRLAHELDHAAEMARDLRSVLEKYRVQNPQIQTFLRHHANEDFLFPSFMDPIINSEKLEAQAQKVERAFRVDGSTLRYGDYVYPRADLLRRISTRVSNLREQNKLSSQQEEAYRQTVIKKFRELEVINRSILKNKPDLKDADALRTMDGSKEQFINLLDKMGPYFQPEDVDYLYPLYLESLKDKVLL